MAARLEGLCAIAAAGNATSWSTNSSGISAGRMGLPCVVIHGAIVATTSREKSCIAMTVGLRPCVPILECRSILGTKLRRVPIERTHHWQDSTVRKDACFL
jgi:hypothetical protein